MDLTLDTEIGTIDRTKCGYFTNSCRFHIHLADTMAKDKKKLTVFLLDIAFLCFALIAIYHLFQKPFLPAQILGDYPIFIDNQQVFNNEEVEFLLSGRKVGTEVVFRHITGAQASTEAIKFYSMPFIIFDGLIILLIFTVGAFVFYKKPEEKGTMIFHFTSTALATAIIGTKTLSVLQPTWIGHPMAVVFFMAYTIVPVFFIHFTFVFPNLRWKRFKRMVVPLYIAGILISLSHAFIYINASSMKSLDLYRESTSFSMAQNGFVFLLIIFGICNFIFSYHRSEASSDRKKIRWMLFGLSLGPAPFVFFWALPISLGLSPIIPEIGFKTFLLIIPVTFAISILKHHAMNIDLIINRGTVYIIVIGIGLIAYLGIVAVIAKIVTVFNVQTSLIASTITATVIALSLDPIRRKVQLVVDKLFFRVQYDYRQAQKQFIDEIKGCVNVQKLASLLVAKTGELLQPERIGFFRYGTGDQLFLLAQHDFDFLQENDLRLDIGKIGSRLNLPLGIGNKLDSGIHHETPDEKIFTRWGIAVLFPFISEQKEALGFLALGPKKSGLRYSSEDIDLLNSVAAQSTLTMERIILQQRLLLEQAETQRLEELSRLKSYFVSSVSHDLKTPLTSIKMFAELLRNGKNLQKSDAHEYLEIIEGESERLTRLINNVLDFSRIERGVKEYHFTEFELNALVKHVLKTMNYQFKIEKCKIESSFCENDCYLNADKDAIIEALMNLISNSIKYSYEVKDLSVSTYRKNGFVALEVKDRGVGISAEDISHIFEPFFRAKEKKTLGTGGAGLGLAIVKHIMDAHGGKIDIQSSPGTGSVFTLLFPLSMEV